MKLATLKAGGRDGTLIVVDRSLQSYVAVPEIAQTLQQALVRECQEEIGTTVSVGKLLFVADFFKQRDSTPPSTRHVVEMMFQCTVPGDYTPTSGHHPDKHQTGVVWMPLGELERIVLYPASLGRHVTAALQGSIESYLGVID